MASSLGKSIFPDRGGRGVREAIIFSSLWARSAKKMDAARERGVIIDNGSEFIKAGFAGFIFVCRARAPGKSFCSAQLPPTTKLEIIKIFTHLKTEIYTDTCACMYNVRFWCEYISNRLLFSRSLSLSYTHAHTHTYTHTHTHGHILYNTHTYRFFP